ncbi:hypothetical protein Bpfe_027385, partial [Biomphalaria pfeifferi]
LDDLLKMVYMGAIGYELLLIAYIVCTFLLLVLQVRRKTAKPFILCSGIMYPEIHQHPYIRPEVHHPNPHLTGANNPTSRNIVITIDESEI